MAEPPQPPPTIEQLLQAQKDNELLQSLVLTTICSYMTYRFYSKLCEYKRIEREISGEGDVSYSVE